MDYPFQHLKCMMFYSLSFNHKIAFQSINENNIELPLVNIKLEAYFLRNNFLKESILFSLNCPDPTYKVGNSQRQKTPPATANQI